MSSCRESVCFHHRTNSLCLAVAFAFLVSMSLGYAQVTIKERVEIGAGVPGLNPMAPSSAQNYFIAPRNGVLRIDSGLVERIGLPLPANSYLEVTVRDTSYRSNIYTLLPCFDQHLGERDTCGVWLNPDIYWNRWPGSEYCTEPAPNALYVGPVEGGDTIRFSFTGERYNPMFYIEDEPDSVWKVYMQTPSAPGCEGPNRAEYGYVFVSYARPKVLRIIDHTPHEIWPYLPPQNKGDSRGADQPGYNPTRGFSIRVLDSLGQPLTGVQVRIKSEFDSLSGGHQHNNPRLPADRSGLFYKSGSGTNPKSLTTDSSGTAVVDSFRASQIAGRFLITASFVSDSTVKDTVNLNVRVPALVNFANIQSNYWGLTGNTGTTTYDSCYGTTIRHPSNHFCIPTMAESLQIVLIKFLEWGGTQEGGGRFLMLDLNDMSLENGGVFDICNTWNVNRGHSFHRIGASVDIENCRRDFETGQVLGPLKIPGSRRFNQWGRKLERIMNDHGGIRYDEGPIHFGFGGN